MIDRGESGVARRPARPEDVEAAADLFLVAVADLHGRSGTPATPPPRPVVLANYGHILRTGIFVVAESGGRMVALANAIVRDRLWFLSGFWTLPGLQKRGIGGPLLRAVWDAGRDAGAETFFTWSSVDVGAMASYMKLGLLPGTQILSFAGTARRLPAVPHGFELRPLTVAAAAAVDRGIRGTARTMDHSFWIDERGFDACEVLCEGRQAGYFYTSGGVIGPAAWLEGRDAEAVLALAFQRAAAGGHEVRLATTGFNHAAIRFALGAGLTLASCSHLLLSAPFGHLEHYLPSGPSLF